MQNLTNTTAAILAGGLGTRLRSVVADRPKVLAEIRGRPFLAYPLDQLAAADVRYVVLCTGYLGEQVQAMFGDSYGGLRLVYSQESSPLGTAGALRLALPLFKSDSVLVMNGDSFCDADLSAFWAWHCAQGSEATLLLTKVPDTQRYGRVQVDEEGRVLRFDEKDDGGIAHAPSYRGATTHEDGPTVVPPSPVPRPSSRVLKDGPGWINAGTYLLHQRLLLTIPTNRAVSLERQIFPAWIGRGLYGYPSEGRFLDIGTPEAYAEAEQFFTAEAQRENAR